MSFAILGLKPNEGQPIVPYGTIEPDQSVKSITVSQIIKKDGDATIPELLLVVLNDDAIVNGTVTADEDTGEAGDGTEVTFAFDLVGAAIPGSVVISTLAESDDHEMLLTDGADGIIYNEDGDACGTVDYFSKAVSVTFLEAAKNLQAILADYRLTVPFTVNGALVLVPLAASTVLSNLPYWGDLEIKMYAAGITQVAVTTELIALGAIAGG